MQAKNPLRTVRPLLIPCFAIPLLLSSCSTVGLGPEKLIVGVTPDNPPLTMKIASDRTDRKDQLAGIEVDLVQQLADRLERKLVLMPIPQELLAAALVDGQIDMMLSADTSQAGKVEAITRSIPYLESGLSVLYRVDGSFQPATADELIHTDLRVGFIPGSVADIFVSREMNTARIYRYKQAADAARDISRKRIDLYVDFGLTAGWLLKDYPGEISAYVIPGTDRPLSWHVRKDNPDLLDEINRAIREWRDDGTIRGAIERWLQHP